MGLTMERGGCKDRRQGWRRKWAETGDRWRQKETHGHRNRQVEAEIDRWRHGARQAETERWRDREVEGKQTVWRIFGCCLWASLCRWSVSCPWCESGRSAQSAVMEIGHGGHCCCDSDQETDCVCASQPITTQGFHLNHFQLQTLIPPRHWCGSLTFLFCWTRSPLFPSLYELHQICPCPFSLFPSLCLSPLLFPFPKSYKTDFSISQTLPYFQQRNIFRPCPSF